MKKLEGDSKERKVEKRKERKKEGRKEMTLKKERRPSSGLFSSELNENLHGLPERERGRKEANTEKSLCPACCVSQRI